MIPNVYFHYPLIQGFTFKLRKWVWYHLWMIYTTFDCIILEWCCHNPPILVFIFRLSHWLLYQAWTVPYWYQDRSSIIYLVDGINTAQHIYISQKSIALRTIYWNKYSHSQWMKDWSISCEWHNCSGIGRVGFNN
jgi:hypothetical protein